MTSCDSDETERGTDKASQHNPGKRRKVHILGTRTKVKQRKANCRDNKELA